MEFIPAIKTCFQKFFVWKGRARRSEFWWFVLFTIIAGILLGIVDLLIFGLDSELTPLSDVASLIFFFPGLSVGIRRMHDIGRSGWWQGGYYLFILAWVVLIIAMAIGGNGIDTFDELDGSFLVVFALGLLVVAAWGITLLVFFCLDSDRGTNKYGPSPKYGGQENVFD